MDKKLFKMFFALVLGVNLSFTSMSSDVFKTEKSESLINNIPMDLKIWESRVENFNPALLQAQQNYKAATYRAPQINTMPSPRISYSNMASSPGDFGNPMQQKISMEQAIPQSGLLNAGGKLADIEADKSAIKVEIIKRQIKYDIASAYADYALLTATDSRMNENLSLLDDMIKTLETGVSTGRVTAAALVDVEMERDMLRIEKRTVEERAEPLIKNIRALLGLDENSEIIENACYDCADWLDIKLIRNSDYNWQFNASAFPEVKLAEVEVQAAQKKQDITKIKEKSSYMVGVEWAFEDNTMSRNSNGTGPIMIKFGVNLPMKRHAKNAGRNEAKSAVKAAQYKVDEMMLKYETMLSQALFAREDASRRELLYQNELLPSARRHIKMIRSAYETGKAALSDWIRSQRRLLELDLALQRARAEKFKTEARLRQLADYIDEIPPIVVSEKHDELELK